ncbi:hypothetical protein [Fibrella aquatica]|uniref:hypothetical protein n=1 Tax=Fibrella aquatica TaxID=3242487 RepID=UPI0035204C5D
MKKIFTIVLLLTNGILSCDSDGASSDCVGLEKDIDKILPEVLIRTNHITDEYPSLPEEYKSPILKTKPTAISTKDTLYLPFSQQNTVEFEIEASKGYLVSGVQLQYTKDGKKQSEEPTMDKTLRPSFTLMGRRALLVFRPWLKVPYGDGGIVDVVVELVNKSCNFSKVITINVLSKADYSKHISKSLTHSQSAQITALKAKYDKLIDKSWTVTRFRRSQDTFFDVKKFFAGKKIHEGKFSNEYIAYDGKYKITVLVSRQPTYTIEPTPIAR